MCIRDRTSDTVTILEKLGYYLDEMNNELYEKFKTQGYTKAEISPKIAETLDIVSIVKKAAQNFDGGYVIAGVLGHGAVSYTHLDVYKRQYIA